MINIILLIVFLNNWLSDDLFSGNLDSFLSSDILNLNWLSDSIQSDFLIITSINFNIDFFSLNNWLNNFLIVNFLTRFDNQFFSIIFPDQRLFGDGFQIHQLIITGNKFNLFSVIDDLFFKNRLKVNFS